MAKARPQSTSFVWLSQIRSGLLDFCGSPDFSEEWLWLTEQLASGRVRWQARSPQLVADSFWRSPPVTSGVPQGSRTRGINLETNEAWRYVIDSVELTFVPETLRGVQLCREEIEALALQLPFFEVGTLCGSLVSSTPE